MTENNENTSNRKDPMYFDITKCSTREIAEMILEHYGDSFTKIRFYIPDDEDEEEVTQNEI